MISNPETFIQETKHRLPFQVVVPENYRTKGWSWCYANCGERYVDWDCFRELFVFKQSQDAIRFKLMGP